MDLSRIDLKGDQARRCYYTDEPMPVPSFSELQAFLHEDTAAIRYVVDLLTVAHKRIEQLMERVQRLESKEAQAASTPTSYDVGYEAGVTHLPLCMLSREQRIINDATYVALSSEEKIEYERGFLDGYSGKQKASNQ